MADLTVACVLRSGGDFTARWVRALMVGVEKHLPLDHDFVCLSDVPVPCRRIPLRYDWPGWWAKMELCRPDLRGPILFLDLDTVIVGDVTPLVSDTSYSLAVRDFYRGHGGEPALQSCLMLLTEADRAEVWETWSEDPDGWMRRRRSDQDVYEAVLKDRVGYFQDTHPGMVVGFKTDLNRGKKPVPHDARVVCFHGRPRPWRSGVAWAEEPFR